MKATSKTVAAPPQALSADAALDALAAWMAPMAELALRAGLGHAAIDEAWRMALVSAAQSHSPSQTSSPNTSRNTSQISVATGLHRKEVLRLQGLVEAVAQGELPAPKKRPWASQVLLRWADRVRDAPHLAVLPLLSDEPEVPCFAKLARSVTTDVHPRAVLEELLRLGLVSESDERVSLLVAQFVPKGSLDDGLAVLSDNVRDHLRAGLHNLRAESTKTVEQAIWGEGISLADATKLNALAREAWAQAYRQLYQQICDAPEAAGASKGEPRHSIRVGMYVSVTEMPEPEPALEPVAASAQAKSTKPRKPRQP